VHVSEWLRETEPAAKSAAAAWVDWLWRTAAATPVAAMALTASTTGTAIRGFNIAFEPPCIERFPSRSRSREALAHVRPT
jgi:hypothetical protein